MKYAIYALCVNSHQHAQCQDCRDIASASEDLAVAEPGNDSLPPAGTECSYPPRMQASLPGTALCDYHFLPRWSALDLKVRRNNFIHLSASASKGLAYILMDLNLII